MGMRATVAHAVDTAFNAIGDLVEVVTYKSLSSAAYNPTTGAVSRTSADVTLKRTVFIDFEEKEVDNDVATLTDMKLLLPTADLGSIVPKHEDIFTDSKGRTWEVQRLLSVPTDVITILHVRTSR